MNAFKTANFTKPNDESAQVVKGIARSCYLNIVRSDIAPNNELVDYDIDAKLSVTIGKIWSKGYNLATNEMI